jgi:hypothetical protein
VKKAMLCLLLVTGCQFTGLVAENVAGFKALGEGDRIEVGFSGEVGILKDSAVRNADGFGIFASWVM